MARRLALTNDGCLSNQVSIESSNNLVRTANSMRACFCVETASGPPRSSISSLRHWARALPRVVLLVNYPSAQAVDRFFQNIQLMLGGKSSSLFRGASGGPTVHE